MCLYSKYTVIKCLICIFNVGAIVVVWYLVHVVVARQVVLKGQSDFGQVS